MKKILLLLSPLVVLASQNNLNDKISQLESEIETLKKEVAYHQEDLDERIPIIEASEKKTILDKINFSPELLIRLDKFDYANKEIKGEMTPIYDENGNNTGLLRRSNYEKHYDPAASLRFRLNMSMDFDNIEFYGRMLYMNSSQSNQRICILSRDIKTGTSGSAFDVDRAYFNYSPNKHDPYAFTFTFGILPTSGGTPLQYALEKKRSSMFPALVFDMNTYGFIATQRLGENTFARAIVAKAYTLRPNFYPYQCNRENIDNADVFGLYADTKFHFLGNSLLSFGINMLNNLKAHPYFGPDITSAHADNLGMILTYGVGIDIEKFVDTQTTLFAHYAISTPHPNGNKDDYKITHYDGSIGLTDGNYPGFTEADYASGAMIDEDGYALYIGAKYDFNEAWHIGGEFNYGSKHWFSATQGAEDMFNKLAVRGTAYEAYGIWNFYKHFNTKLSYLRIDEEYTGSGWHFGEPANKDATQNIISLSIEARF